MHQRPEAARSGDSDVSQPEMVELGSGLAAPSRIERTFDLNDPRVEVRIVAKLSVDRYIPVEVSVSAQTGGTAVSSETLRRVPVAQLLGQAVRSAVEISGVDRPEWLQRINRWPEPQDVTEGPTDDTLSIVALMYRVGLLTGEPPTDRVVEQLQIPKRRATDWVNKARKAGFLDPTTKGRAAGRTLTGVAAIDIGATGTVTKDRS